MIRVEQGDSRDVLKTLADNSVDSVVTDPPYALVSIVKRFGKPGSAPAQGDVYARASGGFMGQQWDTGETAFSVEFWAEVFRVLKPGGHVASFSGTRTYHRMACAIEDAGFEIRDQLAWMYGSGFPKSHDVSKGIDKAAGVERQKRRIDASEVGNFKGRQDTRPFIEAAKAAGFHEIDSDEPVTPEATHWQGWGTALKPAWEPICLARKPLIGTVVQNVLTHGTGALNVDGCRVEACGRPLRESQSESSAGVFGDGLNGSRAAGATDLGRWPANILHDGSDEVLAGFPTTAPSTIGNPRGAASGEGWGMTATGAEYADSGSAARFFYTAKADATDRLGTKHPTVKPTDLMQWLTRLITPPGGTVLDPFAGSGSTGVACVFEGFSAILIEREEHFAADARRRVEWAQGKGALTSEQKKRPPEKPIEGALF